MFKGLIMVTNEELLAYKCFKEENIGGHLLKSCIFREYANYLKYSLLQKIIESSLGKMLSDTRLNVIQISYVEEIKHSRCMT